MTPLAMLWLPVIASAVFVFLASSVIHIALPIHKSDFKKMPNEDDARTALRNANIPPGQYMFPNAPSMQECASPEMVAKFKEGPVGIIIMRPNGVMTMGRPLLQWFVLCVVISVFIAYLTGIGLAPGAEGMEIFRISATIGLLGYAFATIHDSIWKSVPWCISAKFVFDGVIYALVTGATFAWLWPTAA